MSNNKRILRQERLAGSGSRAINVLRVASAVAALETVTIGADVYQGDIGLGIVAGRLKIDLTAAGTKAVGTLTSDNTNVANTETVTIDTKVYTFKTTLTPTEGEVLIGASADASLLNLINAINHTGTPGTDYSCAAAHPTVSAATSVTAHAFVVTALYTGLGGNSIASTETSAHLSWGAATLASAADPTAAQFTTALTAAINSLATEQVGAERISANEVLLFTRKSGNYTIACTETLAGSNNAWGSATMYGGVNPSIPRQWRAKRVPNAQEVTIGNMHFEFPFTVSIASVAIRVTSTGVTKAWDGALSASGNRVTLDNSGSTDWAATDTVVVMASE